MCDFLLVRHSNLGPVLHRFRGIAGVCAYDHTLFQSTLILEVFPFDQFTHVGDSVTIIILGWGQTARAETLAVKLFSKYSNLYEKHT